MAWENAIDRLVLRQIHLADEGKLNDSEVRKICLDLCEISPGRPENWFHCGYGRTLLGLNLPDPKPGDKGGRRWFAFGRLRGHMRRCEAGWISELADDPALLVDLLVEPQIAAQVLPSLMQNYFHEGDLEKAVWILELLETEGLSGGRKGEEGEIEHSILVDAGLIDLLARIERGVLRPEAEGALRRALKRAMTLGAFSHLEARDQARFQRALSESYLLTGEWGDAKNALNEAKTLVGEEGRVAKSVHFLHSLVSLRVLDIEQLKPTPDRGDRKEALEWLELPCSLPNPLPEALVVRGTLRYETQDFLGAAEDFDVCLKRLGEEPQRRSGFHNRVRFFLGTSLLASGQVEEFRRASRLIEQCLDEVEPDLNTFYLVHDNLKKIAPKVALKFLDALDLGRGTSPDNLLLVALEYQSLGEPGRALVAAERVLQVATDLDQRLDSLKVRLVAFNMQGKREEAREEYFEIRDLLLKRGAYEELERTLLDEELVGQALDHIEIKCELADLYEEMEGKDWDRAQLKLAVARTLRAKKDIENLRIAQGLLTEIGIQFPELAGEDLRHLEQLLALQEEGEKGGEDPIEALRHQLGRDPSFLVVGGNERQRSHHPKLEAFAKAKKIDAEWLMANYRSPQKLVSQIEDRLQKGQVDGLILLHWNRHETTEPALEVARKANVPARTLFYAGFTSLQIGLEELASKLEAKTNGEKV
jgi:tetratricopeptide (TPR) repeat protein